MVHRRKPPKKKNSSSGPAASTNCKNLRVNISRKSSAQTSSKILLDEMNSNLTEDEADSAAEDYDPQQLQLQDIAAIVLGDVKQVCINEVTSDSENEGFPTHSYNSSDILKNNKSSNELCKSVSEDSINDLGFDAKLKQIQNENRDKNIIDGEPAEYSDKKSEVEFQTSDWENSITDEKNGPLTAENTPDCDDPLIPENPKSPITLTAKNDDAAEQSCSPDQSSQSNETAVEMEADLSIVSGNDIQNLYSPTNPESPPYENDDIEIPTSDNARADDRYPASTTIINSNVDCNGDNFERSSECDVLEDEIPNNKDENINEEIFSHARLSNGGNIEYETSSPIEFENSTVSSSSPLQHSEGNREYSPSDVQINRKNHENSSPTPITSEEEFLVAQMECKIRQTRNPSPPTSEDESEDEPSSIQTECKNREIRLPSPPPSEGKLEDEPTSNCVERKNHHMPIPLPSEEKLEIQPLSIRERSSPVRFTGEDKSDERNNHEFPSPAPSTGDEMMSKLRDCSLDSLDSKNACHQFIEIDRVTCDDMDDDTSSQKNGEMFRTSDGQILIEMDIPLPPPESLPDEKSHRESPKERKQPAERERNNGSNSRSKKVSPKTSRSPVETRRSDDSRDGKYSHRSSRRRNTRRSPDHRGHEDSGKSSPSRRKSRTRDRSVDDQRREDKKKAASSSNRRRSHSRGRSAENKKKSSSSSALRRSRTGDRSAEDSSRDSRRKDGSSRRRSRTRDKSTEYSTHDGKSKRSSTSSRRRRSTSRGRSKEYGRKTGSSSRRRSRTGDRSTEESRLGSVSSRRKSPVSRDRSVEDYKSKSSTRDRSVDKSRYDERRTSETPRKSRSERSSDRSSRSDRYHGSKSGDRYFNDRYTDHRSKDRYSSDRRSARSYSYRNRNNRRKNYKKSERRYSHSSDVSSDDSRVIRDRIPNDCNTRRRSKYADSRSNDFPTPAEIPPLMPNEEVWHESPQHEPRYPYARPPEPKSPPPPEPRTPPPPEPSSNRRRRSRFESRDREPKTPPEPRTPPPPEPSDECVESKTEDVVKIEEMLKSLAGEENWDESPRQEYSRPPEPKSPPRPRTPPEPSTPPVWEEDEEYPRTPLLEPSPEPEEIEVPVSSPVFQPILENEYKTERSVSKGAERMICDCVLTKEEILRGEKGCGEDCLNRLLLIECCSRCTLGERCSNKKFQNREYPKCETYKTKKKGHGLRTLEDIPCGTFIMEYVGEVLDSYEFERRAMVYAKGKSPHFYFMSLKSDCIIDATAKGNISRFINHSCEPNAETQKWTVRGELRIGFFSMRNIKAGEEITFDYKLQRYGKQAQRCYCEAPSCNGWIGGDPNKQVNEDKRGFKLKRDEYLDWETALDEISQVGLNNRHQTLSLNRLMVHAKELPVRMQILQLIEEASPPCRRLFVDYQGLPIIWSWMVDCTPEQDALKIQILKTLSALPITNKTILVDSKILSVVEQWAFVVDQKTQSSEALSAQSVLESVEDIASADETPVSEMAQKVLNNWSTLREAYKIPRKERIQQMKKHEQEADQNTAKQRPRRLPMYAEQMRDRYHRNRHNRDKDFEKIYFDRMNDYDGSNSSDHRKRRDSPDRRNFEHRKHFRKQEFNKDNGNNKFSKHERRFMFEMKVARENERKREEEEQQQQWLNMFYSQHQPPLPGMIIPPPQYLTSVPPPSYPSDPKQPASTATRTHPFYSVPPPTVFPAILPAPLRPPSTSNTSNSISPAISAPNVTPQYYNRTPLVSYPPPTPVSYPRPVLAPTPEPLLRKTSDVETFKYDFQTLRNQLQGIPGLDKISASNEGNEVGVTEAREADKEDISPAAAVANAEEDLKLPPKWKSARDNEGRVYYYHTKTRVSQWYPPAWESKSDDSSNDSAGEDGDDVEFKKRRRKRGQEEAEFDMDAEIKENLAAMSSEFQDSDYEDYSPVLKGEEPEELEAEKSSPTENDTPPVANVPLITEHIISPREPISEEERRRNKKRIRDTKEKLRKHKKLKMTNGGNHGLGGSSNGHVSNNGNKLVSAPADTSSITERKRKDAFRSHMANFVVTCLNPYFRSSCTHARITNYSDFKHLARKLTHFVMLKELKHCHSVTDLTCNTSVKHKAKEYIRKYMSKFGEIYVKPPDDNNY